MISASKDNVKLSRAVADPAENCCKAMDKGTLSVFRKQNPAHPLIKNV